MDQTREQFLDRIAARDPGQPQFLQAVHEWIDSVWDLARDRPDYRDARLLERMVEPDRVVTFRVVWEDDAGRVQLNRGYRVQFNQALGPYKGGLRFHPSVDLSVLKFLGFEQVFKNSLTGLPLGGGKGGSDFDPKGRSDREVMRFCQAFVTGLWRHLGPDTDVPAGDIGVGAREVGFLAGQYQRLAGTWDGTFTGKGAGWGGSLLRPEATGWGLVYFTRAVLGRVGASLDGATCAISGSGNVARHCAEKLVALGARPLTLSDSSGFVFDPQGFDAERLAVVREIKEVRRARISDYVVHFPEATFHPGARPWAVPCDLAFPCATENELSLDDARALIANGCRGVFEGANMPTTPEAARALRDAGRAFGPGKAANAGGVAVSGLEMSQNAQRLSWTRDEVDARLQVLMADVHEKCVADGDAPGGVDYVRGANVAGFRRVADAMLAHGLG